MDDDDDDDISNCWMILVIDRWHVRQTSLAQIHRKVVPVPATSDPAVFVEMLLHDLGGHDIYRAEMPKMVLFRRHHYYHRWTD